MKTVRFTVLIDGNGRDDIEFDINDDDEIVTCHFEGNPIMTRLECKSPVLFRFLVDLVGGRQAILSKEPDQVDEIEAHKNSRAI